MVTLRIVSPTLYDTCAVDVPSLEDASVTESLTTPASVAELSVVELFDGNVLVEVSRRQKHKSAPPDSQ